MTTPSHDEVPGLDDGYFDRWNYAGRSLSRFSMYGVARRYYAALVRRFAPAGGSERTLVELGCGLGHLLALLQDDFRCTGVDLLQRSVDASREIAPRAEVRRGPAEDLASFAAGSLDVVVALHLVEHLVDPQVVLRSAASALRPGGVLLFATPNPEYSLRRRKDPATDAIGIDPTHVNCQPPPVWRQWCTDAGLTVERQFGDGLWDVPYVPAVPALVQKAVFGLPAMAQVLTSRTFVPVRHGVNQVVIARRR